VSSLLDDPELARRWAARPRVIIRTFSVDLMVRATENLYADLLAEAARRRRRQHGCVAPISSIAWRLRDRDDVVTDCRRLAVSSRNGEASYARSRRTPSFATSGPHVVGRPSAPAAAACGRRSRPRRIAASRR
jgi:hypothetical protein